MENIFVEFLPPWIETGLQPAFYDKESGTVLQQTARMYARVNMLIRMFNKLSKNTKTEVERFEEVVDTRVTNFENSVNETVANYIEQFNQLHDYVQDYFDNLDVQEEINNKLDEMLEDGVLQEIITTYIQSNVAWTFDTVADMKQATNLIDGSYAQTLGYYAKNDKGGALYKITESEPSGFYETLNSGLYAEMIPEEEINVKQFGAKGDGTNDDTTAIQNAIDYGFANNYNVIVPAVSKYYKTTLPIILKNTLANTPEGAYWFGKSSKLIGDNNGTTRIVKIGENTYTDNPDTFINNINATIICSNSGGTGIYLENLTLENYQTYEGTTTTHSTTEYGLYGNVCRSTIKNINICSYKGIWWNGFSNNFENIAMSCTTEAFHNENGTSNKFRFLYAPKCHDPFYIRSQYSTIMDSCTESCTGTMYNVGGLGLTVLNCGSESPKAQYIFYTSSEYSNVKISNVSVQRQEGDPDNNISLSQCSVVMIHGSTKITVDGLHITEPSAIDTSVENSSIFTCDIDTRNVVTSLKNLFYKKNFTGTNNTPCHLWGSQITRYTAQTLEIAGASIKYYLDSNKQIVPVIGSLNDLTNGQNEGGGILNPADVPMTKSIWLDCEDKYHTANGNSIQYTGRHRVGDLHLYNDPLAKNALGLTVTAMSSGTSWSTTPIPIVLAGPTSARPTENLYNGLLYFDTTLHKPIWNQGGTWYDASGTSV